MEPNFDDVCLGLLTLQGFFVMWWEYKVYSIHNERGKERARWREQKRKSQLRNSENKANDAGKTTDGPTKCITPSETSKDGSVESAASPPKKAEWV